MRKSKINRKTSETSIYIEINLDGNGKFNISTGIGFLDHMLEQLSKHSLIDINLKAEGDLKVDDHHTTEDSGIALGEAISKAIPDGGRGIGISGRSTQRNNPIGHGKKIWCKGIAFGNGKFHVGSYVSSSGIFRRSCGKNYNYKRICPPG